MQRSQSLKSIFRSDENCWRVARADKMALIVDAADYFRVLRKIILNVKHELLLIGWDFDFEIEMLPGDSDEDGLAPDGFPNQLGAFLEAAVERAPDLNVYLLKWNGAALAAPGRWVPTIALSVFGSDRIHFALDGHHPFGACHHQKIVVADDKLAFCGGIDATEDRWDTSEHLPSDPRRVRKDGSPSEPWHDATSALTGPAATALAELSRMRWQRATGDTLERPDRKAEDIWPDDLGVDATDVDVAIARTEPPYDGAPLINEIEHLYIDSIKAAEHAIYIESQYFASETVCAALEARLREQGGPEIIVINPKAALSQFEDDAMHVLRARMIDSLRAADHEDRFRIYYPVTSEGDPIYVHAKIMIADASVLRIGSSNLNDRSMGFDTECDVAIEGPEALITAFRVRLLSEHLGVEEQVFNDKLQEEGSLIGAIYRLNTGQGRGLRPIDPRAPGIIGGFLADTRLLDPRYHPGEVSTSGQGVRPRHLTLIAGVAALGGLAYLAWRRWDGGGRG
ncbi:phospholipase D-like domain-containing protein [Roseovarius dicentrarchi]|uniref:phospholipase D-like domain-containing protein n=1 Tax=Roseovarius dicentrarchi TaxID=2250573 RepID=UPI000DEB6CA4|nr:phospholipase D-like domain-containing protein [Roseovarius dicentrarchi]